MKAYLRVAAFVVLFAQLMTSDAVAADGAAAAQKGPTPAVAKKGGKRPDFWAPTFQAPNFNNRGIASFTHRTLTSRKLRFDGQDATPVGYTVYLPSGYESSSARFPVLYVLHGLGGNESTAGIVVAKAHELMTVGELKPFIIVSPNGGRAFYGDQFAGKCQVHDFFFSEFIPHIDATYRTKPERAWRHIQGFSMGGYGAMMYAAKHPERFGAVLDIAGALQGARYNGWREMYDASEEHYRPFDLWVLAEQNKAALQRMPIAIWVGSADICLPANQQFHEHLQSLQIPHAFNDAAARPNLEGVGHDLARYYELYGKEILTFHADAFGK